MIKSSRFKTIPPEHYDGWYETPSGKWTGRRELTLVLDALEPVGGDSILDIGCGTGWFTRQLGELTGVSVTGVDIDEKWLEYARSRDASSFYCQANALALPFEDQSFSHVLSITALCFTPDWKSAIAEAVRVAKKRIAIGLLNRNSLLWWQKGRKQGTAFDGADWISPDELMQVARSLPLEDIRISTAIYFPSGSAFAQASERILENRLKCGSFLLLTATVIPRAGFAGQGKQTRRTENQTHFLPVSV